MLVLTQQITQTQLIPVLVVALTHRAQDLQLIMSAKLYLQFIQAKYHFEISYIQGIPKKGNIDSFDQRLGKIQYIVQLCRISTFLGEF